LEIPEIIIPEIPTVNHYIYTPLPVLNVPLPNIDLLGCVKTHRDASVTNTQIIEDDVNGAFYSCPEGKIPSFVPINYDRKRLELVEQKQEQPITTPEIPKSKTPEIPKTPEKKEEIKLEPCPGKNQQRIGSFVNEKKLERIKAYIREENGDCTTVYEKVNFKDQYIPEFSTLVSTTIIAGVAASTPLILNAVKPLVKQVVKKLTKKKDKVE